MLVNNHPEVLVAGAGPVGMATTLVLANHGIEVALIDAARVSAVRSYACALHSRSLELLERLGIIGETLQWAHCLQKVAFYDGHSRRAEVDLAELDTKYPFVAVLPQNALEYMLERAINQRAKISVNWRHRLASLQSCDHGAVATVNELEAGAPVGEGGYLAAIARPTMNIQARFVVGADGQNSTVRQYLGVESERMGETEFFSIFEFETDIDLDKEVRVVLEDSTTNVLWPISSRRCRWSFQVLRQEIEAGFPEKDRNPADPMEPGLENQVIQRLQRLIQIRAPWFRGTVLNLNWVQRVRFDRRLSKRFRSGSGWLVGDAAHQTSPVGMQSLNVGLWEADELGVAINNILRSNGTAECEATWNHRWQQEWARLFDGKTNWSAAGKASDWVRRRAARIPPCLPATGEHLAQLLGQLGFAPH